jgi:hypothetical protein
MAETGVCALLVAIAILDIGLLSEKRDTIKICGLAVLTIGDENPSKWPLTAKS